MPTDAELLNELDGYGHLNYIFGDDDWLACADYALCLDSQGKVRLAHHVVVDNEKGAFVDTVDTGVESHEVSHLGTFEELVEFFSPLYSLWYATDAYFESLPELTAELAASRLKELDTACTTWGCDIAHDIIEQRVHVKKEQ